MPPNLIRQAAERITPESTRDSAAVDAEDAGCVGPCTPQSPIDSYSSRHSAGSVSMHRDRIMKAILRAFEQCQLGSACASCWTVVVVVVDTAIEGGVPGEP